MTALDPTPELKAMARTIQRRLILSMMEDTGMNAEYCEKALADADWRWTKRSCLLVPADESHRHVWLQHMNRYGDHFWVRVVEDSTDLEWSSDPD